MPAELKIAFGKLGKLGDKPAEDKGGDPKSEAGEALCEAAGVSADKREDFLAALEAFVMSID